MAEMMQMMPPEAMGGMDDDGDDASRSMQCNC